MWVAYDDKGLPLKTGKHTLPRVTPGSTHTNTFEWTSTKEVVKITVEVFRPTGYSVHDAKWQKTAEK